MNLSEPRFGHWIFIVLFAGILIPSFPGGLNAAELSDLANRFGQTACGSGCTADLDNDEDVDGRDIFKYLTPTVSFDHTRSSISEGENGLIAIRSGTPFTGNLDIRLRGPALTYLDVSDCIPDGENEKICTRTAQGGQVTLGIQITDDKIIQEIRWLSLQIEPSDRYSVGPIGEHILTINENDRIWDGVVQAGHQEVGFSVEILCMDGYCDGSLMGVNGGIIPAGRHGQILTDSPENSFGFGVSDAVLIPAGTFFISRETPELQLALDPPDQITSEVMGTGRLLLRFPVSTHLDRDISGTYVLSPRPVKPSTHVIVLEDQPL